MKRITVNTSGSYDIIIENGVLKNIPSLILPFCKTKKVLIVTDDIVNSIYGETLLSSLLENGFIAEKFVFKNGEKSKCIDNLSSILEFALQKGFHRNDLFLALGGGVVGDITGLASALFMRGINLVQVPTTLLSATDSSIGGKTAVNLKNGKNSVGVFKQPNLCLIDTKIIKDLPDDIFFEGMGEVIKYAVIKKTKIFDYINSQTVKDNLDEIIYECLIIKKEIVEKDEFDMLGIRNQLNAGHTIAHAIESLSGYTIPHGKAVGMGLVIEAKIGEKLGITDSSMAETIEKAIKKENLFFDVTYDAVSIANACLNDKKNRDSKILFLLPEGLGGLKEVKLSKEELENLL